MDPHEASSIYIKDGLYGDQMHAKRDFKNGDLVSYYNGLRFSSINWSNLTRADM